VQLNEKAFDILNFFRNISKKIIFVIMSKLTGVPSLPRVYLKYPGGLGRSGLLTCMGNSCQVGSGVQGTLPTGRGICSRIRSSSFFRRIHNLKCGTNNVMSTCRIFDCCFRLTVHSLERPGGEAGVEGASPSCRLTVEGAKGCSSSWEVETERGRQQRPQSPHQWGRDRQRSCRRRGRQQRQGLPLSWSELRSRKGTREKKVDFDKLGGTG
jgi:hypothetical protein